MQQQTLVLGRMPVPTHPDKHLAAGVWCFAGQEIFLPDWQATYTIAPEPFHKPETLELAARQARILCVQSIPVFAKELWGTRKGGSPPSAFWEFFLAPWCINAAMQVIIYAWRAQSLIHTWGHLPLRVHILPEQCPFTFGDEQDFILGGALNHHYVHWLLSRFLEAQWPASWRKIILPLPPMAERCHHAPSPQGWKNKSTTWLRSVAVRMSLALPFPPIKGFGWRQCLTYSWALWHNRRVEDNSLPLVKILAEDTQHISADFLPHNFLPLDPIPLLRQCLPMSIKEAALPTCLRPAKRKRLRVGSVRMFEDAAYRARLAAWRGQGHKLAFVQHGGNYGHVRNSSTLPLTEYCQHAFITWGWHTHSPFKGNFVPLPHGQLTRLRDRHRACSGKLLYVGTEITVFTYRMDSRPTPQQYVQYREDKQRFFTMLGKNIRQNVLYRPYFSVPGTLEDAPWLLPRFPDIHLCVGHLDQHMLDCCLLVLDHHGTTLELAMAANVPMVLFWDAAAWALCPETQALLHVLHKAQIWHPTPEAAALHVYRIWDNIPAWWQSPEVQEARTRWSTAHALTTEQPMDALWIHTLKTL